ncbi:MAG: SLC13 family permease [Planctomycetota bacterium]
MDPVLAVFVAVYVGMVLGRVPFLALDRSGIALLGGIALLATGSVSLDQAFASLDAATLCLLFGLMLLSAQLQLSGFYSKVTRALAARTTSPRRLLAELIITSGALSAFLTNDVVCLAIAPVLVDVCRRRALDPVPFLLGLAAASNTGSAATLLGNPQNLLIGEALQMSFAGYLRYGVPTAVLGLAFTWWWLQRAYRGRFERSTEGTAQPDIAFHRGATTKGLVLLAVLVLAMVVCPLPRAVLALLCGGAVLWSRRFATRAVLHHVDLPLLLLFAGLFVINGALSQAGYPERWLAAAAEVGLDVQQPIALFAVTALGSNVVSNVPLVMLLLPAAQHPLAGPILALSSTLAGNLLLIGSIANLIVVEQARRCAVTPVHGSWARVHFATGLPITIGTMAIAVLWLWLCA